MVFKIIWCFLSAYHLYQNDIKILFSTLKLSLFYCKAIETTLLSWSHSKMVEKLVLWSWQRRGLLAPVESQWNKLGSKSKGHLRLSSGTHWGQMCALKSPGLSSKDPPLTWKNWHLWILSKGRDNLPDPENPGPCDTHAHILDGHVDTHSHPHAYTYHAHLHKSIIEAGVAKWHHPTPGEPS